MDENEKDNAGAHSGHRQRLIDKFLLSPDSLTAHELTELLLFYAIPRKNVNEVAHSLINVFGNVTNILNAEEEDLLNIDGIGKNAAAYIKLIAKLIEVTQNEKLGDLKIYSLESVKPLLINLYRNAKTEIFTAFYLSRQDKIINRQTFTSGSKNSVSFSLDELGRGIYINKPYAVVIAHNHCSGICKPSYNDDVTTEKLYMLFQLNGVNFYDHLIIAGNSVFSYHFDGNRLDGIKNKVNSKLL